MNSSHLLCNAFWVMTSLSCHLFSLFGLNWSGRTEKTVMKKPMMIKRGEEARMRQTWCLSGCPSPKQTSYGQQVSLSPAVHNNHQNQVCSLLFIQESPSRCFASSASTAGSVLADRISPKLLIVSRPKFLGKMCSSTDSRSFSSPLLIHQNP